jgi:hypothetical protein
MRRVLEKELLGGILEQDKVVAMNDLVAVRVS